MADSRAFFVDSDNKHLVYIVARREPARDANATVALKRSSRLGINRRLRDRFANLILAIHLALSRQRRKQGKLDLLL